MATLDPESGELTRFYNPRKQRWEEHFVTVDGSVQGLTPEGRATVSIFRFTDG